MWKLDDLESSNREGAESADPAFVVSRQLRNVSSVERRKYRMRERLTIEVNKV